MGAGEMVSISAMHALHTEQLKMFPFFVISSCRAVRAIRMFEMRSLSSCGGSYGVCGPGIVPMLVPESDPFVESQTALDSIESPEGSELLGIGFAVCMVCCPAVS